VTTSAATAVTTIAKAVEVLISGFPCTSISHENNNPKSILDEDSASGNGLKSLLDAVDYHGQDVAIVLTENVKTMFHVRKSFDERPIDLQNKALKDRGFLPAAVLARAQHYVTPHGRTRAIGMYIKYTKTKWFKPDIERQFRSMKIAPLPLAKYITDKVYIAESKPACEGAWTSAYDAECDRLGKTQVEQVLARLSALPNLRSISVREVCVLAVGIVDLLKHKQVDAFKTCVVLQVDAYKSSRRFFQFVFEFDWPMMRLGVYSRGLRWGAAYTKPGE
jgi:site-specific DNA-cytosine methylase